MRRLQHRVQRIHQVLGHAAFPAKSGTATDRLTACILRPCYHGTAAATTRSSMQRRFAVALRATHPVLCVGGTRRSLATWLLPVPELLLRMHLIQHLLIGEFFSLPLTLHVLLVRVRLHVFKLLLNKLYLVYSIFLKHLANNNFQIRIKWRIQITFMDDSRLASGQ